MDDCSKGHQASWSLTLMGVPTDTADRLRVVGVIGCERCHTATLLPLPGMEWNDLGVAGRAYINQAIAAMGSRLRDWEGKRDVH